MKRKWFGLIYVMVLVLTVGTLGSASTIVKDRDTSVLLMTPPYIVAGELDEEIVIQLEALYGAGDYTGDKIYSKGADSVVSVVKDGERIGWHLVSTDGVELFQSENHWHIFMNDSAMDKITAELQQEMSQSSNELLPVYVWLKDIDTEKALEKVTKTRSSTVSSNEAVSQSYLMQERECLSEAYTSYNNDFLTSFFAADEEFAMANAGRSGSVSTDEIVDFVSAYAPVCLLDLSVSQIQKMVEDDRVVEIGLFSDEDMVIESEAANGAVSCQGAYVRDTNGYTGEGAIVGICEAVGFPDKTLTELDGADITLDSRLPVVTDVHASRVAAIICGDTVGLAPDCKVYATYMGEANNENRRALFMDRMEWLISQGVHVINVSLGINTSNTVAGTYNLLDRWVDHIHNNHNVLVVKSAGNTTNPPSSTYITSPGMAYNGITVGSYDDNNDTSHDNDVLSNTSRYEEVERVNMAPGYEDETIAHAEKPDIVAPGVNISVPGLPSTEVVDGEVVNVTSGTSFAAPYVTGAVAQIIDAKPELKTQPGIIKAALLASAFRNVSATGNEVVTDATRMYEKSGAGKLDSKNAIYVVASENYVTRTVSASTTTQTFTLYISETGVQMRAALTWLKENILYDVDLQMNQLEHEDEGALDLLLDRMISDWNITVRDPEGKYVTSSSMPTGNVEIVAFTPKMTGTYTITVTKVGGFSSPQTLYFAWW